MTVYLTDKYGFLFYIFGALLSEDLKTTKFLIENFKEEDIFYDIGANYGYFTLLAQEFIKTGEIHSFEPNPIIFELLKINADIRNFPNTHLNELALSNKKGIVEFYDRQITGFSFQSSLIKKEDLRNYKVIKVRSEKIDDYISDHRPPTVMKIDVEGAEKMILEGSKNLLKNYSPLIIIEIFNNEPYFETVKILKNYGYSSFYFNNAGNLELIKDIFLFMKAKINYGESKNIIFKKI